MKENSVKSIRGQYGKGVKIIIMIRHGLKTEDGKHITAECLNSIIADGIPGIDTEVNVLQHGSYYPRTDETGTAISLNLLLKGDKIARHLPADNRLGNPGLFNLYTPEMKMEMQNKKFTNYQGLRNLRLEEFMGYGNGVMEFIKETFARLNPGDVCLVPTHTPTVEIAYNFCASRPDEFMEIKELEYIFLVLHETTIFSMKRHFKEIKVKV